MSISTSRSRRGAIVLSTFSRDKELSACLEKIIEANKDFNLPLIVVHQLGYPKVGQVISDFRSNIDYCIELNGENLSPLENINRNRILSYQLSFNWLQSDWVIAIEEDVLIAKDTVKFVNYVMEKYDGKIGFRGVNLGSRELKTKENSETYSKLRFGINGQASAITRKTWNHFNQDRLISRSRTQPFDAQVENFLKTGYMITPNASRLLDTGWNGTHAPKDPNEEYYLQLRNSWVGMDELGIDGYTLNNTKHSWRGDIKIFRWFTSPWSYVRNLQIKTRISRHLRPRMKT